MNKDKGETDLAPNRFKLWETVIFEKRDGTTVEINKLWYCWFETPQESVKLMDMDGKTWVELTGDFSDKIGEWTDKDGNLKQTIERHLNKCEIIQVHNPATLDEWAGVDRSRTDATATEQWKNAKWGSVPMPKGADLFDEPAF